LHNAAIAAAANRAAIVGIIMAQIAPADNPLLLFFVKLGKFVPLVPLLSVLFGKFVDDDGTVS